MPLHRLPADRGCGTGGRGRGPGKPAAMKLDDSADLPRCARSAAMRRPPTAWMASWWCSWWCAPARGTCSCRRPPWPRWPSAAQHRGHAAGRQHRGGAEGQQAVLAARCHRLPGWRGRAGQVETRADAWRIRGAAVPIETVMNLIAPHWPDFAEVLRRLARRRSAPPPRWRATSPTARPSGDSMPCLMALAARWCCDVVQDPPRTRWTSSTPALKLR